MPCPFGYTADDEEEEVCVEEEEIQAAGDGKAKKKSKASTEEFLGKDTDGLDKQPRSSKFKTKTPAEDPNDPLAWFYSNQIKCEKDFQAKKEALRAEAKKRLDKIMDKKNQRLQWPSDSEFDNMSISSGELSELDSDVHSLASIRSCAYSWITSSSYNTPAETAYKWASAVLAVVAAYVMYIGFKSMTSLGPMSGMLRNQHWATYSFLISLALAGAASTGFLSTQWRSKRMLLGCQVAIMLSMAGAVLVAALMFATPTKVDTRMQQALCGRWKEVAGAAADTASSLPECASMAKTQAAVASSMASLKWGAITQAVLCVIVACLGMWYMLELCFIEKKGVKHMRRHRRKKFSIPWDKIKLVGNPLPCGQGKGHAGAAKKGGCPMFGH